MLDSMDQNSRWNKNYTALLEYTQREGHSKVPSEHTDNNIMLGNWVAHQRQKRKRGLLDPARVALLEALPGWEWGPLNRGPARDAERDTKMRALSASGLSLQQIAEQFGVSRQRVHQIVRRAEVAA